MHWELSDEHEMFATSLREWLAAGFPLDVVRELADEGDAKAFDAALIAEGWWGVGYPEAAGGQGGGTLELALAAREFGRAAATDAGWLSAALAAPLLSEAELAAQLAGTARFALAVSADRAPSWDPLETTGGTVTGSIPHVLGAADAQVYLVPVAGADGPGIARVPAGSATVVADGLLDRTRQTASLDFQAALITDVVPAAVDAMTPVAVRAATLVAADALGAAEKMLALSVEYSKQRKQFGRFIGSFQAVQHACAQMLVTVEAGYSSALYAAAALDSGHQEAATIAAVAKAQVTDSVAALADSALTVHGAIGYTWEHDLHLFYKRAKLDRPLYGTPQVWNERIATALLSPASEA